MRKVNEDRKAGVIKLIPEVLDDLYHLAQLIDKRDRVRAMTWRTPEIKDEVERRGKIEKKRMHLTLEVEDVEFQPFSDRLRVHGVIVEGPQDLGAHHTFNIDADGRNDLAIQKPGGWRQHHRDRIKEAEESARQPRLYILAIEDDEATLAEVRAYGAREVAVVRKSGGGKMYEEKGKDGYLPEVVELVAQSRDPSAPLIVVGPGWTRERLVERLRETQPDHMSGVITEGTGQAGMVGVHEAIRRGLVQRVVQDHAIARDTDLFERLMAEIAKSSGLAAYGVEEVHHALGLGAVETLLITDRAIKSGDFDELLERAEETRTHVHVLSTEHEAGERLHHFGDVAAHLRFAVAA
ncbi:MAG: mRNA surveillance protein pelota [Euryarchaeota archaeon]|nr:mRNA surveillance protein pelota [Euryarchaeota archaeon]